MQDKSESIPQEVQQATLTAPDIGEPEFVEPDLEFKRILGQRIGTTFEKCFQCGTCSATCTISPDLRPFPRKEMAWISWGLKDRLLSDPDIWLCYQCNDCSTRCPRGAHPGDILGAIRQEAVINYSIPYFIGKRVNQPQYLPLLLGIPALLLTLALYFRDNFESALGITRDLSGQISYPYSSVFPHWLLNSFFFFFTILSIIILVIGVRRQWKAMKNNRYFQSIRGRTKKVWPSFLSVLKSIFTHDNFDTCEKSKPRFTSHIFVFFGFIALTVVTSWVITSGINPLIKGDFVYPFSFWSPWKILANVGGLAVLIGCLLMAKDRLLKSDKFGAGSYFDWMLLGTILLIVITGFVTEILHYVRLEPHRHLAYFAHLVFVATLIMYLPYSKLAHLAYRTTALVFAEHTGRKEGMLVKRVVEEKAEEVIDEPVVEEKVEEVVAEEETHGEQ